MTRCRACNTLRPDEEMTFVRGAVVFAVCRPHPERPDLCFRNAVMGREVHTLIAPLQYRRDWVVAPTYPIRPGTPEWGEILGEAHA